MTSPEKKPIQRKDSEKGKVFEFDPENTNFDTLLPDLIKSKHIIGVSTVLEACNDKIKDSTLLACCIYLAKHHGYLANVEKNLKRLENPYPAQVASIRAYLLITNCSIDVRDEKCNEALKILEKVRKSDPQNPQILYNEAYIYALLRNQEMSFNLIKSALQKSCNHPPIPSVLLLLIRILRSNCQTKEALDMATQSYYLLNKYDKYICIEGMYAAVESGDLNQMKIFSQKLERKFKKDTKVMETFTKINLMVGKTENATKCFQTWSSFDNETPEFFFCCAQLCSASQNYENAIHHLMLACQLDPSNANYLSYLATIYANAQKHEKAYDCAKDAVQVNPYSVHAWLALSNISPDENEARNALAMAMNLRKTVVDLEDLDIILQ